MSGLSIAQMDLCDQRHEGLLGALSGYDVLILPGGHVPTQNNFFNRISLKERMKAFRGIVIGISAGTMNCADTVYAQPELPGESACLRISRIRTVMAGNFMPWRTAAMCWSRMGRRRCLEPHICLRTGRYGRSAGRGRAWRCRIRVYIFEENHAILVRGMV